MSETPSTFQLQPGDAAPDFTLPRPADQGEVSLAELTGGKPLLIVFACNHCPYVIHLAESLGKLEREYRGRVEFVAISSNDVENYPQDSPEKMVTFQAEYGWDFSYLYDETQEVAKAYGAACTPDFFLFDANHKLAWAGQFDDTRPRGDRRAEASGKDLRAALEAVLEGSSIPKPWHPATGCSIKWKPGKAPDYFA